MGISAQLRGRRLLLPAVIAGSVLAFAGLVVLAAGFYYSSLLEREGLTPDYDPPSNDLVIVGVTDTTVELRPSKSPADLDSLRRGGTWGLEWDGGYGQVSDVLVASADSVTRAFRPAGTLPAPGTAARFDENAFPTDPTVALGLAFEDVPFDSSLGTFRAWLVPADPGETWMVFVHGRDADRRQGLRLLETLRGSGVTALLISYRNDQG
ncbi:MAG TPA: hypothetical protein VFY90_05210, partial [Tepidiformaceae bacterium]|nr:hypothetical protein [Tepidiformaceae bacterium]